MKGLIIFRENEVFLSKLELINSLAKENDAQVVRFSAETTEQEIAQWISGNINLLKATCEKVYSEEWRYRIITDGTFKKALKLCDEGIDFEKELDDESSRYEALEWLEIYDYLGYLDNCISEAVRIGFDFQDAYSELAKIFVEQYPTDIVYIAKYCLHHHEPMGYSLETEDEAVAIFSKAFQKAGLTVEVISSDNNSNLNKDAWIVHDVHNREAVSDWQGPILETTIYRFIESMAKYGVSAEVNNSDFQSAGMMSKSLDAELKKWIAIGMQ